MIPPRSAEALVVEDLCLLWWPRRPLGEGGAGVCPVWTRWKRVRATGAPPSGGGAPGFKSALGGGVRLGAVRGARPYGVGAVIDLAGRGGAVWGVEKVERPRLWLELVIGHYALSLDRVQDVVLDRVVPEQTASLVVGVLIRGRMAYPAHLVL